MKARFIPKGREALLSLLDLALFYKDKFLPERAKWDNFLCGYLELLCLEKMVNIIGLRFWNEAIPYLKDINKPKEGYRLSLCKDMDDFLWHEDNFTSKLIEDGSFLSYFEEVYGMSISLEGYVSWFTFVTVNSLYVHMDSEDELQKESVDTNSVDAVAEYYLGELIKDKELYPHLRPWMEVIVEYLPYGFEDSMTLIVMKSSLLKELKTLKVREDDKKLQEILISYIGELRFLHSDNKMECLCGQQFIETQEAFYWIWNYGFDSSRGIYVDGKFTYPHTFYLFFMVELLSGYLKEKYL